MVPHQCGRMLLLVFLIWLATAGERTVECSASYVLEDMCNQQQFHRPAAVGLWAPFNPTALHPASSRPRSCTCHLVVKAQSTAIVHVGHMKRPAGDDCQTHITLHTKTWSHRVCATTAQNFTKHQLDLSSGGLWVSYRNTDADSQVTFVINIKGVNNTLESWVGCAIGNKKPSVTFPTTPSAISDHTTKEYNESSTSKTLNNQPVGPNAGLSTGVIAIAVVSVVGVILLAIGAVASDFIWKRHRQKKKHVEEEEDNNAHSKQNYVSLDEVILPGECTDPHKDFQASGQSDTNVQYSHA